MDWLSGIFDFNSLPGHLSYIILSISYLLTNMLWLRITAIIAMLLEIVYFSFSGGSMAAGIAWDTVFVVINVVMLWLLLRKRFMLDQTNPDHQFLGRLLTGLDPVQIGQILRIGTWRSLAEGEEILHFGEQVTDVALVISGYAEAVTPKDQRRAIGPGTMIGEMSFVTGDTAIASVTAKASLKVLSLPQQHLKALMAKDPQIASVMYRLVGRVIAERMRIEHLSGPHEAVVPAA
jgi:Cyclic nucleotide-binding domain